MHLAKAAVITKFLLASPLLIVLKNVGIEGTPCDERPVPNLSFGIQTITWAAQGTPRERLTKKKKKASLRGYDVTF